MKHSIKHIFSNKVIKIAKSDYTISNRDIYPDPMLLNQIVEKLWFKHDSCGFLILVGLFPKLISEDFQIQEAKSLVNSFRRKVVDYVFKSLMKKIPDVINPLNTLLKAFEFEVEGYNVNENFQNSGINFHSTKQLHFDIVEPISSNLYGLNYNIRGGLPVFASSKMYCQDKNLDILEIIEKIPGNRIITIKKEHYVKILNNYAYAFELDANYDIPFSVYLNRIVEVGILHGATEPFPIDKSKKSTRPIIHYSYDNQKGEVVDDWYNLLDLSSLRKEGDPSQPKPLIPSFHCENILVKTLTVKY